MTHVALVLVRLACFMTNDYTQSKLGVGEERHSFPVCHVSKSPRLDVAAHQRKGFELEGAYL